MYKAGLDRSPASSLIFSGDPCRVVLATRRSDRRVSGPTFSLLLKLGASCVMSTMYQSCFWKARREAMPLAEPLPSP